MLSLSFLHLQQQSILCNQLSNSIQCLNLSFLIYGPIIYLFITRQCLCAQSLNRVRLFVTPWTVAHQAPLPTGILQARILGWVAIPFSRGSSQPRDGTQVSHIAG